MSLIDFVEQDAMISRTNLGVRDALSHFDKQGLNPSLIISTAKTGKINEIISFALHVCLLFLFYFYYIFITLFAIEQKSSYDNWFVSYHKARLVENRATNKSICARHLFIYLLFLFAARRQRANREDRAPLEWNASPAESQRSIYSLLITTAIRRNPLAFFSWLPLRTYTCAHTFARNRLSRNLINNLITTLDYFYMTACIYRTLLSATTHPRWSTRP